MSRAVQRDALTQVLRDVRSAAQRGQQLLVVVDIDDTVANGRLRLRTAARTAGLRAKRLTSGEDLYAGLDARTRSTRQDAFRKLYFDDPALARLDSAQRGARAFLRAVQRAGGRVLYVSGRYESTRKVTLAYLRRLRLPLAHPRDLMLNADEERTAVDWKRTARAEIARRGRIAALFDNEPETAADYKVAFPGAHVFRLATFRFQEAPAERPKGVWVVRDFSLAH